MPKRKSQVKTQVKKVQQGGAWWDAIWRGIKAIAPVANQIAKDTKIVSKSLNAAGLDTGANIASSLGYGMKKKPKKKGGKKK